MKASLLLAGLVACAGVARGDILFLGFNPAEGEIAAVEKVAGERGEKIIVVPTPDAAKVARHRVLMKERERLRTLLNTAKRNDREKLVAERGVVMKEIHTLKEELKMTDEQLARRFDELGSSGVRFSSVVISGHDGNGRFWGLFGGTTNEKLTDMLKKNPSLHENTKSLALLGCYTSTVGAIETYWKGVMPSVRVVGGYEGSGPLATHAIGHNYVMEFLRRDDKLAAAATPAELLSQFKKLPEIRKLTAAIATRQSLATGKGARTIEEYYRDCEKIEPNSELRRSYECYDRADKGCENPPTDTKKGVLRKFYNELHGMTHCRPLLTLKGDAGLPDEDIVLRFIYFHTIRENFVRIHAEELAAADALLADLGIATDFARQLGDAKVTRAALFPLLREANVMLEARKAALPKTPDSELQFLQLAQGLRWTEVIDRLLLKLEDFCVPEEWVDPGMTNRSVCMHAKGVEDHALRAWNEFIGAKEPDVDADEWTTEVE